MASNPEMGTTPDIDPFRLAVDLQQEISTAQQHGETAEGERLTDDLNKVLNDNPDVAGVLMEQARKEQEQKPADRLK
jgi:hypothetical protein